MHNAVVNDGNTLLDLHCRSIVASLIFVPKRVLLSLVLCLLWDLEIALLL